MKLIKEQVELSEDNQIRLEQLRNVMDEVVSNRCMDMIIMWQSKDPEDETKTTDGYKLSTGQDFICKSAVRLSFRAGAFLVEGQGPATRT